MLKQIFNFFGFGRKQSTGFINPSGYAPLTKEIEYVPSENEISKGITEKILKDLDICPSYTWERSIRYNDFAKTYTNENLPYSLGVDDNNRLAYPTLSDAKYGGLSEDVLTEKHQKEIYRKFHQQILDRETKLSLKEQNDLLQIFKLR